MKDLVTSKFKKGEGHIGSAVTAYPIIRQIYNTKGKRDIFILSSGHAGMALYQVLKEEGVIKDYSKLGLHPVRNPSKGILASTGSLGHGLPIALGMALANTKRDVHCLITDGECMEGSIWETLIIADRLGVNNLIIHVNANGWGGYDAINLNKLQARLDTFNLDIRVYYTDSDLPHAKGLDAHYQPFTKESYETAICSTTA